MLIQRIVQLNLWKKKPFYITVIFLCLFSAFCLVRIGMPCREYSYEGSFAFEPGIPAEDTVIYEGVSLSPGVYRVEAEYVSDTDWVGVCNVADGTVCSGGLLSNGEHMYSALRKTGYDMWLFERTDNLQVTVSYEGAGNLVMGNLKIVETNQMWTMLLAGGLFVGVMLCLSMLYYYYDRMYTVSREKKNGFFFVLLIAFLASIPYLSSYTITGADLTYHLQRIEGVRDGLLGGQFPVRLEPKWLYSMGYANGIFYCNTFLYFPALLRLLGFPISISYNLYCIALNIATAAISFYCFKRIFRKQSIGIVCSALYTLSVFRIYKLVITCAVGEGTAVTFLPLVFYGLYRVFTEDPEKKEYRTVWIPIMLGYAGLIQSHVLTCEITALVTILICLVHIRKVFRRNTFWELLKGASAALFVSFWFLVPFLDYYMTQDVHIKHVSARTIQSSGLYPAHLLFHFWSSGTFTPSNGNGLWHSHPVGIGMALMGVLALFLILWFSGAYRRFSDQKTAFAKVTALIGVLLLFMSTNAFPWDRIQLLHPVLASLVSSLQFPNRFLGWGTVCLVFLTGYCMWYFSETENRYGGWILAAAAVFGVTTSSMYLTDYVCGTQQYYELYNEEGMGFGYISGAEYLIQGTDESQLTFMDPKGGEGLEIGEYERKSLGMELQCANLGTGESYVDFPFLFYKGYRAEDAATGQRLQVDFGENNVVRVSVPENFNGTVRLYFASPFYWRISELVTLVTAVSMAASGIRVLAGKRKRAV